METLHFSSTGHSRFCCNKLLPSVSHHHVTFRFFTIQIRASVFFRFSYFSVCQLLRKQRFNFLHNRFLKYLSRKYGGCTAPVVDVRYLKNANILFSFEDARHFRSGEYLTSLSTLSLNNLHSAANIYSQLQSVTRPVLPIFWQLYQH